MIHVVTVLSIVSPVFLLAAIGFAWVKLGLAYDTEFVTRLAMTLAVPALIFTALAESGLRADAVGRLTLATLATYGAILLGFLVICLLLGLSRPTYLAPLTFGNTGNLGLPLALFAFGENGLALAVVVFAISAILSFTVGLWIVAGGGQPLRALREPMVPATLLGGLVLWQGWAVPDMALNALGLIGQMAIPLMLITLGVAVARLRPGAVGPTVALAVVKVVLCAAIGWAVAAAFALDPVARNVLIMQAATPVAVTAYLIALKYGADADRVAGLVVISTLLSVFSLPALLAILL
ncbi:MAG: AEC family transporter [Pseudomonadota bacterium]